MSIFTDGKGNQELIRNLSKITKVEMDLNLSFNFSHFYFVCVGILPACMSLYQAHAWYPWGKKKHQST